MLIQFYKPNLLGVLIHWIRNPFSDLSKETQNSFILGLKNLLPKKQNLTAQWLVVSVLFHERKTTVRANDGVWHHICFSWEKARGSWKFFKDGFVKQEGTDFRKSYTIRKDGILVLGQDQDDFGDDFDADWSLQGMLSHVNIWDRVLGASQIKEMSQSCLPEERNEGNVYKWIDFLREGGVKLVEPSPCVPFTSLGWWLAKYVQ